MTQYQEFYNALMRAQLLVSSGDERFFEQFGLGTTRYYALYHLQQAPGLSLSLLSQRLLCTKGNTTRILRSLESDGLLLRQSDPHDNRALRFYLTPAGVERLEQASAAFQEFHAQRFALLSAQDCDAATRLLQALAEHLQATNLK